MLNKRWFQLGIGVLIAVLIIKFFLEIDHIFKPLGIILGAIFVPLLAGGILFYITEPLQRVLEKKLRFPRWASILAIIVVLIGVIFVAVSWVAPYLTKQITLLVNNIPWLFKEVTNQVNYVLTNRENFPEQVTKAINDFLASLQDVAVVTNKFFVGLIYAVFKCGIFFILISFFYIFLF